jgi:hypothetical protein
MSLDGHLRNPSSPVRRLFEAEYPNWRGLRFRDSGQPSSTIHVHGDDLQVWTMATLGDRPSPLLPEYEEGYPWSAAGGAFDYRLRYEFQVADPGSFAAARGWRDLVRRPRGQLAPDTGWHDMVTALDELTLRADPTKGPLSEADELDLARLCGLLALYEQLYRMGGLLNQAMFDTPLARAGLNQPLTTLLDLVDPQLPADVVAMIREFRRAAPELASAERVNGNPQFDRSRDLGGADGDLILDHRLLEVKTTKHAKLTAHFVWQVLGYLLADTSDEHSITTVGWYFARHGLAWVFEVDDFLRILANRNVDVSQARAEFEERCSTLRKRPVPPVSPPPPISDQDAGAWARPWGRVSMVERVLPFHPPVAGRGRWHATAADVPWVSGTWTFDGAPEDPACSNGIELNLDEKPIFPPIGALFESVDQRCCRRCLRYTETFYAKSFEDTHSATPADLPYHPPARGSGKWHIRQGDTGFSIWGSPDAAACGATAELDLNADPLRPRGTEQTIPGDGRLCLRCLKIPASPRSGTD